MSARPTPPRAGRPETRRRRGAAAAPAGRRAFALALVASALLGAAAACGGDAAEAAARAAFARYQDALFAGDRPALRAVLSVESRPVVPHLPLERAGGQQRLEVLRAERHDPELHLVVRDPNAGGAERTFVLVREDGEMRVDLVATTAFNHERRPNPGGGYALETRPLTPAELAWAQREGHLAAPLR
jgi:hypothetical protein